ncbi:MAG: family 10 glycosylhydrolase, partial [Prevotella sp.]|nr:family 10 glycosylhydrolase [Prevotella sp.]
MNRRLLFILLLSVLNISVFQAQPKREFRGAWIQCVNGQFIGLGTEGMQQTLRSQLDELQRDGVNAVIFQVRAECDAMYPSNYEPWSRFLTGQQGVAPQPYWDPLKWMIDECHKRGMELHAWINPYRAKTKTTSVLASSHIANTNPERVFKYDDQYILNPGQPENREYICKIATDITRRYDIDGFHIDDYFYPYPAPGQTIQDDKEFQKYNNGIKDRGDWRRYNVNLFIKQLSDSIHAVKPWVKFGVSPFGIYRNKKSSTIGSQTSGMQNYDDLYADVLLWVNNGWVDYCVPQLYWQVGHSSADYEELIKWWNRYASNRPLYIGEDVERTVKYADPQNPQSNQLPYKRRLHDEMKNVDGTVLWYAKSFVDNTGNYAATMRTTYWRNPALQPLMPFIDAKAPKKPRGVKPVWTKDGYMLFWRSPRGKKWGDKAAKYVIYRFNNGENI